MYLKYDKLEVKGMVKTRNGFFDRDPGSLLVVGMRYDGSMSKDGLGLGHGGVGSYIRRAID